MTSSHVYTVEFRIFSDTLDPSVISHELGIKPCQVRAQGLRRSDGKAIGGMWAYNGEDDTKHGTEWSSLEEGLVFVLNKLWPLREIIAGYASNAKLVWWCGNFQSSFDGGPTLSPRLLGRLGEFGAELFIDNYFSGRDAHQ